MLQRPVLTLSLCCALAGAAAVSAPRRQTSAPAASSHGIDLGGMDRSIKPGDDFFGYANGAWVRTAAIPSDQPVWGVGMMLAEEADARTRGLLEQAGRNAAAGSDARKAGDYYAAFMDDASIERRGIAPLKERLDRIAAIADRRALAVVLGESLRADVDALNNTDLYTDNLFGVWVAQDFNDPTRNTAYLLQGGLGMPDREYYVSEEEAMRATRTKYLAHVGTILSLAALPEPQQAADRTLELETKIARAHASREDSGDVQKANNLWRRAEFTQKAPGLDWPAFFEAAGLSSQDRFIVWQPSAITGEAALVASEPLETWKAYLQYQTLNHWSNLLPKAFAAERFDFYGKVLSGTEQIADRWKRAVAATNDALGDAVGKLYVDRYFGPDAKAKAQAMVADLKAAFGRRIDALEWMAPQTKAKAKEKLQTLIVGVGYPDRWRDYSALQVARDDALTNAMRSEAFDYRRNLAKLEQAVDRHEWWMTPQTVNAVNLPIQNALNFPAAILQPPFFDPAADAALNYGSIGAVIGHEVSHSFDNTGSQFDATGKLANWWQTDDFAHFRSAASRLVAQYNAYQPLPGLSVNGQQTLGENIADVAGLAAAYDAYRASLKSSPSRIQDGISTDQQFFLSYAQSWRDKIREPLLRQLVLTDEHSPSEYRADCVRNLDAWYSAFNVQPEDKLYLAPGDRVRVW
jgi:putative endopeptidase